MDTETHVAGGDIADGTIAMLRTLATAYARRVPVERIAVVANAPLPASDGRAALIDSCDLVVRTNGLALDAPGGPPTVGHRADVVVFNRGVRASRWLFENYRDRLYLMVEPGRLHWEPAAVPEWWPADLGQVPVPNREVTIPLSDELGIDVLADPHWATTGTVAAWLAHRLFPAAELNLAGYSAVDAPHQSSWEHAVGDPCPVGPEHLLERESALLRGWIESGIATLHR